MAEEDTEIRQMWSGTLSFGLVSIPVAVLPGSRRGTVPLRMLAPDGAPLRRRYFCPADEVFVHPEHILRGYEIDKGEFVIVHDEELESLEPRKSRDIDLQRFVPAGQIPPFYFDRPYYLTPDADATKAYRLLAATIERSGRAGLATFVMRTKEYLVAILAEGGILRAETLRFQDELRSAQDVGLGARPKVSPKLRERLEQAIEQHTEAEFDPAAVHNEHAAKVMQLVQQKDQAGRDVIESEQAEQGGPPPVEDLVAVLQESMKAARRSRPEGEPPRTSAARATATEALPIAHYEEMSVAEAKRRLPELDEAGLRTLREWEKRHKNRKTMLQAIDRRIDEQTR